MLGSGAIVVMDETTDAVRACLRIVRFFARESCGKCTPVPRGHDLGGEDPPAHRRRQRSSRDIDLLLDVADNISPGPYPVAAFPEAGLEAVPFPPRQTTICPLGPSSVAPITSAIRRFRREFEAKITRREPIPVGVDGDHEREAARHHHHRPGDHHRRRRGRHGAEGRAADRRRRARRVVHPALLLPPADDTGGHVSHVPGGGRHRAGSPRSSRAACWSAPTA